MLLELLVVFCLAGEPERCVRARAITPDCVLAFQELKSRLKDEVEIRAIGCRPLPQPKGTPL